MTIQESRSYSYLNAIGTAVPNYKIDQSQIADLFANKLDLSQQATHELRVLHRASGIRNRYTVIPDFLSYTESNFFKRKNFPKVSERMQLYVQEAPTLSLKAIENCLLKAKNTSIKDITHLITVSCTGMYAPGLDIQLIEATGLNTAVQRTAINFMGCYGAFNGLKVADNICRSQPDANVLLLCVELCTIHFQDSNAPDDLLSSTLFADGAAAALIQGKQEKGNTAIQLRQFYCDLFPDGKRDMSWHIGDFGFEMKLSAYVPALLGKGIGKLLNNLLANTNLNRNNIDLFAIHPGGKRILEVIEEKLEIEREQNRFAFEILKNYGNMSSVTILFVLDLLLKEEKNTSLKKNIMALAFGPGLTMESALMRLLPS
ncbi:MAG: type III polyketide synthase [Bacteroidota bacterium]